MLSTIIKPNMPKREKNTPRIKAKNGGKYSVSQSPFPSSNKRANTQRLSKTPVDFQSWTLSAQWVETLWDHWQKPLSQILGCSCPVTVRASSILCKAANLHLFLELKTQSLNSPRGTFLFCFPFLPFPNSDYTVRAWVSCNGFLRLELVHHFTFRLNKKK